MNRYSVSLLVVLLLAAVAYAATPSTRFPGKNVPEVDDASWGSDMRGWMLSTDAQAIGPSFADTVTVGKGLTVGSTADFAGTVNLGGSATISRAGYATFYASHSGMYVDTRSNIRKTAMPAGAYTVLRGWKYIGLQAGTGYAVAVTGTSPSITIGANGAGMYRVQVQMCGTHSAASGAALIELCVFVNDVEASNAQDIRSFSTSTDVGRLGAFGHIQLSANDVLKAKIKSSVAASFRPYRGNIIIERIGL